MRSRVVEIPRPGGVEVLRVVERDVREPGPGEVRIRVRAAAVNPTDILLRENGAREVPPWVPGMDAAGTIESVGEGVGRFVPGDEVMAAVSPGRPEGGAQSELLVAPAAWVVPIPIGATLEQAATLPMNGMTAQHALHLLDLSPGETLAVSGGAGVLASYAIGLAKERGLRVVADAAPRDEALVASFGVDEVLPRGEGFPAAVRSLTGAGADALLDTALLGEAAFPAVRDCGAVAVVRGWSGGESERGIRICAAAVRSVLDRTEWLEELRRLAADGRLQLRVAQTYTPEGVADAHEAMAAGGLRGRGVLVF
jgi:NADPH:quinone reductase